MNDFVLDCSLTMTWCFSDQATALTKHVLDQLEYKRAIVPSLWFYEVGNVLLLAERKKKITPEGGKEFLQLLNNLPIFIAEPQLQNNEILHRVLGIGRKFSLSLYDATYLELAFRNKIALATLDKELITAAKRLGVSVLR